MTLTALVERLDRFHHLATALTNYGDRHQDHAEDDGDDDNVDRWFWVAATARMMTQDLDDLEVNSRKIGILDLDARDRS